MKKRLKKLIPLLALAVALSSIADPIAYAAQAVELSAAQADETKTAIVPAEDEVIEDEVVTDDIVTDETDPTQPDEELPGETEDSEEAEEELPENPDAEDETLTEDEETVSEEEELPEEEISEEEELPEEEEIIEEDDLETTEEEGLATEIDGVIVAVKGSGENPPILLCYQDYNLEVTNRNEISRTATVAIRDIADNASDVEMVIPDDFYLEDAKYHVTGFEPNSYSSSDKIASFVFPKDLRTLYGNLFDFKSENTKYLTEFGYDAIYSSNSIMVPNEVAVLSSIPRAVSDHYENGAYYAGKCLVRVDPNFKGDVKVKDGTICVLAGAFLGCKKIGKVTLPASVEFIGMRAFANSSVTSVNLPANLSESNEMVPYQTFYGCNKLQTVKIEVPKINTIGYNAFFGCSSLKAFDFTKVAVLDGLSFASAFDPKASVVVDLSNTQLISYAHFYYSNIKEIRFGGNKEIPTECCLYNKYLSKVRWDSVERVGCRAFEGCKALKGDFLAEFACSYVDYRAFANTGISSAITIRVRDGKYSQYIAGGVFANNPQITTVTWDTTFDRPLFSILNDCGRISSDCFKTNMNAADGTLEGKMIPIPSIDYTGRASDKPVFIKTLNIKTMQKYSGTYTTNFSMQPYLETLNIQYEAEGLCDYQFQFCPRLKTVKFSYPQSLKKIGFGAFEGAYSLREFPFAQLTNLEVIGSNAFLLCNMLGGTPTMDFMKDNWVRTDAEDNVLFSVNREKLAANIGLKNVDLSKNTKLTNIGFAAFENQLNAKKLVIPASVKKVDSSAFVNMNKLEEVVINCPIDLEEEIGFGRYSLLSCFFNVNGSSHPEISGGKYGNASIKKMTLNNVDSLISSALAHFLALETITIKGSIEELPDYLFTNCGKLKSVSLPEGLKSIGYSEFYGTDLQSIKLPKSVKTIKSQAFWGLKHLKSADLPGVEEIGDRAFYGNEALTTVTMPNVKNIGTAAFQWCKKLKTVDMNGVDYISYAAFYEDAALSSVKMAGVKTISACAFMGCTKLASISVPNARVIEPAAFMNCTALKTAAVTENVLQKVDNAAFYNTGFTKLDILANVQYGQGAYAGCKKLQTVVVHQYAPSIADFMFTGDTALKSVTFEGGVYGVNGIGWGAFKNSFNPKAKAELTLPSSLTNIQDDAFANCNIKALHLNSSPFIQTEHTYLSWNPEDADLLPIPENVKVTVPASSVEWSGDVFGIRPYKEDYAPNLVVEENWYSIDFINEYSDKQTNTVESYNPADPKMATITLKAGAPVTGYTFDGWYSYDLEKKISKINRSLTGDLRLYAQYKPNTYKIVYDKNSTRVKSMNMPSATLAYDEYYQIPEEVDCVLTSGAPLTLYEWNTKKDGTGVSYGKGDWVVSMASKNGETVKLYAIWREVPLG